MNERIQQLAEQATTKISFRLDPNTYKHIDDPEGDFERVEFDKQKFAELIVRECIAELESVKVNEYRTDVYDIGYDDGLTQAVETIKEYFGVEE